MLKQIILLLISVCLLSSGAENLIKNANFAQRNPDGTPAHWKIWPEKLARGVTAELDTTMSTSGGVSFRIRHDDQNPYTRINQIIPCKGICHIKPPAIDIVGRLQPFLQRHTSLPIEPRPPSTHLPHCRDRRPSRRD